jgi:hypothetical protein
MTTTPDEPLKDDDMTTGLGDATGSVPSPGDADGTDGDGSDADGTDADGTDGGDADGTDA